MTAAENTYDPHVFLDHFDNGINRLAVSQNGEMLATSDINMNVEVFAGDIKLYSRNFGSPSDKVRPTERIRGLKFSPDRRQLYVVSGDHMSGICTTTWLTNWVYEPPRSFGFLIISPTCLDVAMSGEVAAAFDNGSLGVFTSAGAVKTLWRDGECPRWLRFAFGGSSHIVGSDGAHLCIWNATNRKREKRVQLSGRAYGLEVDSTGSVAAVRSLHDITFWDLATMQVLSVVPIRPGAPVMAFHPTEKCLAFAEQNHVKLVDVTGAEIKKLDVDVASALSLAFSADGATLYAGCTEHVLISTPFAPLGEKGRG